jgi:hypothetical protein
MAPGSIAQPVIIAVRRRPIFRRKDEVLDCGGQMTTCPATASALNS